MAVALGVVLQASVSMGVTPKAYTDDVPVAGSRGGLVWLERRAEAPEIVGSNPAPAIRAEWTPGSQEPSHLDLYVLNQIPESSTLRFFRTVAPEPVATVAAASVGQLSEAEMRDVLAQAGFAGDLLEQALRVSHGESVGWQPGIVGDGGHAYGLFQIHPEVWITSGVCEGPWESLFEPVRNARCAKLILDYEAARRYPYWSNWTVKP